MGGAPSIGNGQRANTDGGTDCFMRLLLSRYYVLKASRPNNFIEKPRTDFRRLLPNALMHESKDKYLWQCPECGCRAFVIQGPLIETGVVQCVACHAEIAPVDEFLAAAEALIESEKQERQKRRFH
jgi:hypothetical protein